MEKVKQSKKQIKPIDLDNIKARYFSSETSSGRFLALSLFTLLTIIAAAICEFLKAIQIKDYDTAPFTPLNLTLVALIISLELFPSFIRDEKLTKVKLLTRLEQEEKDKLVNNTSLFFTIICTFVTAICLSKAVHTLSTNNGYSTLLSADTIINLFAFFSVVYFVSFFPYLAQIKVSPFFTNMRSLKRIDYYQEPKQIIQFLGDSTLFLTMIVATLISFLHGHNNGETILIVSIIIVSLCFQCYSHSLTVRFDSNVKWVTFIILLLSIGVIAFWIFFESVRTHDRLSLLLSLVFVMCLCALLLFGLGFKTHIGNRFIKYSCSCSKQSIELELSVQKENLEDLDDELKLEINRQILRDFSSYSRYKLRLSNLWSWEQQKRLQHKMCQCRNGFSQGAGFRVRRY